jgi:predicted nuclease with TOPRIM domain
VRNEGGIVEVEQMKKELATIQTEFEGIQKRLKSLEASFKSANEHRDEMRGMVKDLHAALMVPQPGQKHSLLDRMAKVTIDIESGGRLGTLMVKIGATLAAVGASLGAWRYWG